MADSVLVRNASASDRNVLIGFHKSLYQTHRDHVVDEETRLLIAYRDYEAILEDDLDATLADPGALILLAEVDGEAIGYITGRLQIEPRRALPGSRAGSSRPFLGDVGVKFETNLSVTMQGAHCD